MSIEITKPTEGNATITLPYDEAEILFRAVGHINTGSMRQHAPTLYETTTALLEEFGRSNDREARKYLVEPGRFGQMYINDYTTSSEE